MAPTLADHLQAHLEDKNFAKLVTETLAAAGLRTSASLAGKPDLVLKRVKSMVPDANWLEVGEHVSSEVERHDVTTGKWTTRISLHFDRPRLVIAECHTRGVETDYNYSAWANAKRHPKADKAEAAWTKLLAKYRIGPASPTRKQAPAIRAKPDAPDVATLWAQYWEHPGDLDLLRVYADALEQAGDPRGSYIQLSLVADRTPEQEAAREALANKHKGALVGPAKSFVREYELGPEGLVEKARTELPNLCAGIDELGRINPHFILTLTSVKTLKDAEMLGKVSPEKLGRIYMIDFGMITGSFGGCQLNDKQMAAIAPAFVEVRHLQLSCGGSVQKCFSPDGLRAFGNSLRKLRYLSIAFHQRDLPPAADYARAIAETPGFATLRALDFDGVTARELPGMKLKLNQVGDLNFDARNGLATKLERLLA